ncbi:MAG TPA: PIN domain-containing protein [Lacipirellulaceae bacterium]|jgi:predicted nucleic acid-binding protein|nr:PIN domain-containing protein [Lacipirellulaceae bacterium]
MSVLLDTGILLRLINESDPLHADIELAVNALIFRREDLLITTQNITELWNVASRPTANNGLALSSTAIAKLYDDMIEPVCAVLIETKFLPVVLRRLLIQYNAIGKQVHDARLVAMMLVWQVDSILTLNDRDFRRYEPEGITIVTPASLVTP